LKLPQHILGDRHGHDHMKVGFITSYAISTYYY